MALSVLLMASSCQKTLDKSAITNNSSLPGNVDGKSNNQNSNKKVGHFNQVNLVANTTGYGATNIDPTLINAWGIAFNGGNVPWVNSQGGHVSELYNGEGQSVGFGRVKIPLPNGADGGNPTGTVFSSSTSDFLISGGPARFIFVGLDGTLSAWNGTLGTKAAVVAAVQQSVFTGLALATNGGSNFLYAANFSLAKINVWSSTWAPDSMSFTDPNLPAGYSPYNIQNIDGMLYVAYAKVGPQGRPLAGVGLGIVNVFQPNGMLVKRFATGGTLNAPWGLTKAPSSFFKGDMDDDDDKDDGPGHGHDDMILVGNFGDGHINAYREDGKFKGLLRGDHDILTIDGLWAISFPPAASTIDHDRLYFAAGPRGEEDGLFGYIISRKDDKD